MGSIRNELNPCALGRLCRWILSSSKLQLRARIQQLPSYTRSPGDTGDGTNPSKCCRLGQRSTRHNVLIKSKENKKKMTNSPKQSVLIEQNHPFLQQPVFWVRFWVFFSTQWCWSFSGTIGSFFCYFLMWFQISTSHSTVRFSISDYWTHCEYIVATNPTAVMGCPWDSGRNFPALSSSHHHKNSLSCRAQHVISINPFAKVVFHCWEVCVNIFRALGTALSWGGENKGAWGMWHICPCPHQRQLYLRENRAREPQHRCCLSKNSEQLLSLV